MMWPFEDPSPPDPETLRTYEEAVEALRHRPHGPPTDRHWADLGRQLNRLASLRADAGDLDGAMAAFDEAMQIWDRLDRDKAHFVSSMRRAMVVARDERGERALVLITELIERAQSNPSYQPYFDTLALYRGAVYAALDDVERAVEDLDRAIAVRVERKPGSEAELVAWRAELLRASDS